MSMEATNPGGTERTIWAIIPSIQHRAVTRIRYILAEGVFPKIIHRSGQGTTEDALSELGRRTVGHMLSPDRAYQANPQTLVYLTKALDPSLAQLAEGVVWSDEITLEGPDGLQLLPRAQAETIDTNK